MNTSIHGNYSSGASRRQWRAVGLALGTLFASTLTAAAFQCCAGDVDRAFEPLPASWEEAYAFAIQRDQRVLMGGSGGLLRFMSDGSPDPSFAAEVFGKVLALAVRPDGKILAGGEFYTPNGMSFNLARLHSNGSFDSSFDAGLGATGPVHALVVQFDGKVVVGGNFSAVDGVPRNFLARLNGDGSVDTSFDAGGAFNEMVKAIAVLPDGRLLVAGFFNTRWGGWRTGLARLHADGSLDDRFNAAFDWGGGMALAVQPDGRFLIGGSFTLVNGAFRSGLARCHADGSLDTSFDLGRGFPNTSANVAALALLPNGQILAGGTFADNVYPHTCFAGVARLNGDGSRDPSFESRVQTRDPDDFSPRVNALAIPAAGGVLLGGAFDFINGAEQRGLARLYSDGVQCPGFVAFGPTPYVIPENAGAVTVTVDRAGGTCGSLAVAYTTADREAATGTDYQGQSGTLVFAAGEARKSLSIPVLNDRLAESTESFSIVLTALTNGRPFRFEPSLERRFLIADDDSASRAGAVDPGFLPRFEGGAYVHCLAAQPDGKIIIGGGSPFWIIEGEPRYGLARLHANGSLDRSFAARVEGVHSVHAIAVQPDGKIVVAGGFVAINGVCRNGIARLNTDGTLDSGFDPGAGVPADPNPSGSAFEGIEVIRLQPDGKVVIGGVFHTFNGFPRQGLARLNADGSLDTAFGAGVTPGVGGNTGWVVDIALQPDGKILVAGNFFSVNGAAWQHLARLHPDGSLDTQFRPNPSMYYSARALALQPNGSVIVVGEFSGLPNERIVRFSASGARDFTFDAPDSIVPESMALQADGKILIAGGFYTLDGVNCRGLARLNANGSVDPSFDSGTGLAGWAEQVLVQPDGKILACGMFVEADQLPCPGLVRLNGDFPPIGLAPAPGTVVVWGRNDYGQTNMPSGLNNVMAIAAGGVHSLALLSNGTVVAWGANTNVPPGLSNVAAIAAGAYHSLALKRDGTVVGWGGNEYGTANVPPELTNVTAIAAGYYHSLALKANGAVVGWGRNWEGQCDAPAECAGAAAIAAGGYHSLALKRDGTVVAWGMEADHQIQPPADLRNAVMIACGYDHALALKADGTVTAWAFAAFGNSYGQARPPADLRNVVTISAGVVHNLALRADGVVIGWGRNDYGESTVPAGLANVAALAAGNFHSLALIGNGPTAFVTRHPPDWYLSGQTFSVRYEAAPPANVSVYAVEDRPPAGWTVTNISHGGVFDSATGKVKFGPFFDNQARFLTYDLTPSSSAAGAQYFSGVASADGVNSPIGGADHMEANLRHPADNNPADNVILIAEVTSYGAAWRRGETWPLPPNPVPIDYVTRAAALWKGGECYQFDFSVPAPLGWVNCRPGFSLNAAGISALAAYSSTVSAGSVMRQLPPRFVPGEPVAVSLAAAPARNAVAYAIEEQIPAGWTVANVSHNGALDTVNGKLKWGPFFDANPRVLCYQAVSPADVRTPGLFAGVGSFDGTSALATGPSQLSPSCRLTAAVQTPTGQHHLHLTGGAGARVVIETSDDLRTWTPLAMFINMPSRLEFDDPISADSNQRFYRARLLD